MIDLLDRSLQRLLGSCGADAAVIWSRVEGAGAGSVICTYPVGLLDPGTPWPTGAHPAPGLIDRDPAVVASLVPTSLRLELPAAPTAVSSTDLADSDVVLLLIWCGSPAGVELPEDARRLIAEETADLARIVALLNDYGRTSTRLQAVVNDLKQGVVAVDHARDQVTMNPAAAALLRLEPGKVGASEFAAAMAKLEGRALNRAQVTSMGQRLLADPSTQLDCTWLFAENPTHVHVTSRAIRQGAFSERIWVFDDISGSAQALDASDAAQTLLRATADSMIDPQVLLEAVRDRAGRVIDFRYLSVNPAACTYLGLQESDLIGHTQLEALPNLEASGLPGRYIRCLEDGEPVILDDFPIFNEILTDARRIDIRATRAGVDLISLTWSDVTERFAAAQRVLEAQALLRATVDSMLNPQVLFEAVRDPAGRVVDFVYRTANRATCDYLGMAERDLVGQSALATLPNLEGSGLLERYRQCVETGLPVVLDDFSYFNEILDDGRRYDIRATRAGVDLISLTFSDVTERFREAQRSLQAQALLNATVDSMLNPQTLVEAVRDPAGRVVDFVYRSANSAFCSYRGAEEKDLIGQSLLEAQPNLVDTGLFGRYVNCVDTGESVALDDVTMFNAMLDDHRRFDIRAVRAGVDLISLTFGDVTDRFDAAQRISASERSYRLLAENSSDIVTHVRDGRFAWISPSVADVVGGSPEYWVGRQLREIIPPEDASAFAGRLATLAAGGAVRDRIRVVATDGVTHWVDLHARPLYDDDGHQDGFTGALRLVDAEVAAEEAAEEARKQQVEADARYRRFVDKSITATALLTTDGQFVEVNHAFCQYYGYDADTLRTLTWRDLTVWDDLDLGSAEIKAIVDGTLDSYRVTKRYRHADGRLLWGDLSVTGVRDDTGKVVNLASQITDVTATVEATQQYKLLAENAGDLVVHVRDGRFVWVSPSCTDVIGGSPDYWVGRDATEIVVPEEGELITESTEVVESGGAVQVRHRVQALDGTIHWVDVHAKPFRAPDGREDGITAAMRVIDDEVAAEREVEKAREQQTRADALYRRLMDSSPIGMTISNPDGRYVAVNQAVCEIFGYSEAELLQMTWKDVTVEENIGPGSYLLREILEGRLDTFEFTGQQSRRDNVERWSKVGVSCLRAADGTVEYLIGQIVDVTAETLAQRELTEQSERNRVLAQSLQQKTDRITSELDSAASYMGSIMPRGLHGTVEVSSRYLPSRELGGDCFDYTWIDDDHLLVYLIDISGHGIEPALLSVSVHNILRSGVFDVQTLLEPARVVTELNRLFQMEQQNDHFFTLWLGVYQASTRTLRYSNAGANPVFVFDSPEGSAVVVTELPTLSVPVGMLDDAVFTSQTYAVPPQCQMLIFSDGANEVTLPDGHQMSLADFKELATGVAGSPNWSLDDLIAQLHAMTTTVAFEDDCSLILLTFP